MALSNELNLNNTMTLRSSLDVSSLAWHEDVREILPPFSPTFGCSTRR